jgi:hypothetical protein
LTTLLRNATHYGTKVCISAEGRLRPNQRWPWPSCRSAVFAPFFAGGLDGHVHLGRRPLAILAVSLDGHWPCRIWRSCVIRFALPIPPPLMFYWRLVGVRRPASGRRRTAAELLTVTRLPWPARPAKGVPHEKLQKFTKFAPAATEDRAPLALKRASQRPRTLANFCAKSRGGPSLALRVGVRLQARFRTWVSL